MHLAETQAAGAGNQRALLGDESGTDEQVRTGAPASTDQPGQLVSDLGHLLPRLQVALGVVAVDVPGIEDDEPPGGVEDIGHRCVRPVDVPDGIGEHRRHPLLGGEGEQPGRTMSGTGAPVVDDLDEQVVGADRVPPAVQVPACEIRSAGGQCAADVGVGSEQHEQPSGMRGDQVDAAHRPATLAGKMSGTDESAQRAPTLDVPSQHRDPRVPRVDVGPAAGRHPAHPPATSRPVRPPVTGVGDVDRNLVDGEVDSEDRPHPSRLAGLDEPHRTIGTVPIGQRERLLAVLGGPLDERMRVRRAVAHRVAGRHVQVGEWITHPDATARTGSNGW